MESDVKQQFAIETIIIDKRYQSRVKGLDDAHVTDLMEAYERPDSEIDPPRVWIIPAVGTVLTRGFHRVEALSRLGRKRIECEVRNGSVADALTDAAAGNAGHGLKRTNADKRRSVEMVVEAHPDWSNRRVADESGVSHAFVNEIRDVETASTSKPETRTDKKGNQRPSKNPKSAPAKKIKPEPVKQERDGPVGQSTDEQQDGDEFEVEADNVPPSVVEPPEPEKPVPMVTEVKGRITSVKGFPEPRILRFKRPNGRIAEKVVDMVGNHVPDGIGDLFTDNHLRDFLSQLETAMEIVVSVDDELLKFAKSRAQTVSFAWVDFVSINTNMKKFRDSAVEVLNALRNGLPYAVCPGCEGNKNGCKDCRLCGYWPKIEVETNGKRYRELKKGAGAA